MSIRTATELDWSEIEPIFRAVAADGRTIPWPEDLSSEQAQQLWMPGPPQRNAVAVDAEGHILGSAVMGSTS